MNPLDAKKFARLPQTNRMIERLDKMDVGEILPIEQVEEITGRDASESTGIVSSAIKTLEKIGKQFRFAPKKLGGLKRLTDSETCERAQTKTRMIFRQSKRELMRLAFVDFSKLPDQDKKKHLTVSAQLGALSLFASKSGEKKIASSVSEKPLEIGETMKLFKN